MTFSLVPEIQKDMILKEIAAEWLRRELRSQGYTENQISFLIEEN